MNPIKLALFAITVLTINSFAGETAYRCRAFAAVSRVPKAVSGVFTPWMSGATEKLAAEAAIKRCTDYGTGCSLNKCESYTKEEAVKYSKKCLAFGLKQLPRTTVPSYFPGFGNDDASASENALKNCKRFATACRASKCYDNN